ncbi:tryptophan 7-halogenase [Streptomyces sp. NPDC087440]|uniref:tryptophan 7-halogenase n=1 Tax=Streptomyces sp. NPDC087440 TaxID=3365790 RepID=UPI0037F4CF80
MESRIRNVVVVGDTTAGWLSAVYLATVLEATVQVTVLEAGQPGTYARDVAATGGVQALPPQTQDEFFDRIGIQESDWMRSCDASFRVAARYANWRTGGPAQWADRERANGSPDSFYDPVGGSGAPISEFPLPYFWSGRRSAGETLEPLDRACFREPPLLDARKAPRWLDGRAALRYGWHVDGALFTAYLRRLGTERAGVRTARGTLRGVERDAQGYVVAVVTTDGLRVAGDFFLDCTGTPAALLAGALGEPRAGDGDRLLCDGVVTLTAPADPAGVAPYTSLVAAPDGWLWRMPLPGRTGIGRVYASAFTRPEDAAAELAALCGLDPEEGDLRHHALPQGRSARAWVKNVLAVGNAAHVVEPLDSTAHVSDVLEALRLFVTHFPSPAARELPAARYNRAAELRHEADRDFVQLHHAAAPRRDTPWWRAQSALPVSAAVQDRMAAHRGAFPLPGAHEVRQYALLTAFDTALPVAPPALAHLPGQRREADTQFERVARQQRILGETLPTASDYLARLHGK